MHARFSSPCSLRFNALSVALLLLAQTPTPAAAQAQSQALVQVYGTIDVAVGELATQPPGAPNAAIVKVKGVHSGALQTSYWGLRGKEDLGGGLTARFLLESFIRVDTGATGRFDASPASGADYFWSREAYVALGGAFGEVRLGNNGHPTWVAMIQSSAMGGNSVFSPGFRQLFNGGTRGRSEADTALVNSVKYQAPVLNLAGGGLSGSLVVQAGEGSGSGYSSSGNINWRGGAVFVTAAFSQLRHAALPNLPGVRHQDITLVGGSWDLGPAKVFAQYVTIENSRLATKDKVPQVGVAVPVGPGVFQLARGEDKNTATTGTTKRITTSAGYVHALSKRTELYTFLMRDDLPVGQADSWVLGVRHQF